MPDLEYSNDSYYGIDYRMVSNLFFERAKALSRPYVRDDTLFVWHFAKDGKGVKIVNFLRSLFGRGLKDDNNYGISIGDYEDRPVSRRDFERYLEQIGIIVIRDVDVVVDRKSGQTQLVRDYGYGFDEPSKAIRPVKRKKRRARR